MAWTELEGGLSGQNVTIGTVDTGSTRSTLRSPDPGLPPPTGGPTGVSSGTAPTPQLGDPFTCNDKLIGAAFLDTYAGFAGFAPGHIVTLATLECSARDDKGTGRRDLDLRWRPVARAELFDVDRGPSAGSPPGPG